MYRLFILLALVDASSFHKFHSGDCPQIDSMNDFQMDKFIGQWYVVQNSNDNLAACLREEFTGTEVAPREMIDMARNELADNGTSYEEPEPFKVYQLKRSYLPFGGRQFIAETGKIRFISNKTQSEMEINLPYAETGMLNLKHYQVIGTDYVNYALVWRCQTTIFGHRRSAEIISRKPEMDKQTLKELDPMMKHFEIENDIKFQAVQQANCEVEPLPGKPKEIEKKHPDDIKKTLGIDDRTLANTGKTRKKLISIDVGGFHLSISFPFW